MKDPAFLFYSSDFLTGVADLTMEERGQYITLMCLQHQHGHLSAKTIRLALGCDLVSLHGDVMNKFCIDDNGLYYNNRLDEEIQKRIKVAETHRAVGFLGGRPKNQKDNQMDNQKATHLGNQIENENVNENEDVNDSRNDYSFDRFWAAYPRKVAKADAQKAFKKISMNATLFDAILSSLEKWKKSNEWTKDGGQFIPHAATWLNGRRWEDEAPKPATGAKTNKPSNMGNFEGREYTKEEEQSWYEEVVTK